MSTAIEWTDATKTCARCREMKPVEAFAVDRSRRDGRTYWCRDCRNARSRAKHRPVLPMKRPRGRSYADARHGDRKQARRRVNYLVEAGLIPSPNELPCADCGHVFDGSAPRHEYDHYRGYAAEDHEHVQAVCSPCHHRREQGRGR